MKSKSKSFFSLVVAACSMTFCTSKAQNEQQGETIVESKESAKPRFVTFPQDTSTALKPSTLNSSDYTHFLALFKPFNPKGLHIYSPDFNDNLEVITPQFKGAAINAKQYKHLFQEDAVPYLESILNGYGEIFAIGKFEINEQYTGLMVRQRSQYSDTQISLLLWDKQKKELVKGMELADSFGDEGWYFDTESWITEFVYNKKLSIVTRTKDFEPNEELTAAKVTDSMKVSSFNGQKFLTKNSTLADTARFRLKQWVQVDLPKPKQK